MTAATAPIALITDFGSADGYAGAMKGALLSRLPGAMIVDVTHEIPPGRIARAAFVLEETAPHFPEGSVFLVVVDPGVGSARRPLAVFAGGRFFVGPDNGVLTPALALPGAVTRVVKPSRVGAHSLSRTFHGRDLFAPATAYLAGGGAFERLGEEVLNAVRLRVSAARRDGTSIYGEIVHVDRFGNGITNVRATDLASLAPGRGREQLIVHCAGAEMPLVGTYADADAGALCALVGSSGRLEIAQRDGNASGRCGFVEGTPVRVEPRRRGD